MTTIDTGYRPTISAHPPSSGVALDAFSIPVNGENAAMFAQVREKMRDIGDPGLREKTAGFVYSLDLATYLAGIDFTLPRIVCDFRRNESYMEWIFLHFTVGFNISNDASEDGWFLFSDETLGNVDETGRHLSDAIHIASFIERYGRERRLSAGRDRATGIVGTNIGSPRHEPGMGAATGSGLCRPSTSYPKKSFSHPLVCDVDKYSLHPIMLQNENFGFQTCCSNSGWRTTGPSARSAPWTWSPGWSAPTPTTR